MPKNSISYLVSLVFICLMFNTSMLSAQGIRLYTENFKPFQYIGEDGGVKGFGVDLVKEMFAKAEVSVQDDIRIAIWSSAYETVLSENHSAIFMTVRNKKREDKFKWVGPIAPREMWFYKLRSRKDIVIESLEDAKRFLVGGYKSAQTDYLLEMGFPRLDIVLKEELNFKKLLARRIDLMPSSRIMMASKLKEFNIPESTVERVIIFDNRFDYYLALNKSVSDKTVVKLQLALDELKTSGLYAEMESRYLSDLK